MENLENDQDKPKRKSDPEKFKLLVGGTNNHFDNN